MAAFNSEHILRSAQSNQILTQSKRFNYLILCYFTYYLEIETAFIGLAICILFEMWVSFNLLHSDCIRFWLGPSLPSETLKTAARVMAATVRAV